ncbi:MULTISPECIES: hypothetical protein [Rhodococcus]|uniref:hypothetical protein n=1 Tax=Rhodococcus TaxID=1827 RepID=UPI000574A93C|nr:MULTISPECIES: hypothetical protein [Rhodococcus]KHJ74228.1 hypothetical protein QR64_02735 [Rhodococcus sp. Chr-9]UPK63137.1 hypothetical protein MYP14_20815 [Rhodococcus pyridinivorans]
MPALRIPRRVLTLAAPVAAAIAFTGVATAAPPQPLGTAITIGCINQGSLASFTSVTAQPGPDEGIPGGHVLFSTREALWPVPAAGQVSVAWLNRNNGRTGIVDLVGTYPNLSTLVDTGPGEVVATVFGSVNLGSGPLCNSTPAVGSVVVP